MNTPPPLGIAEVERDTGLHKDTLRVWERRYGFPVPKRDARGDRLYDQTQLQRLRLIKRLLDAGHRPGRIVPLSEDELSALVPPARADAGGPAPPPLDSFWLECLLGSRPEELRAALRQHLLRHGLPQTIERLLVPLGRHVGEAWHAGTLSVFHEHLYSEVVQGVLRESITALDAAGGPVRPPRVLLTTLPQEMHALGLLMAECFFALERCERLSLGPSTPLPEVVAAVGRYHIDIVALSASAHAPPRDVMANLQRLRAQLPPSVELWVGGSMTRARRRGWPDGVQCVGGAQAVVDRVGRWRAEHS